MIKYYSFIEQGRSYQYGKIWITITSYYLTKEGWILCSDFREDFHDSYYDNDSTLTRADYCTPRNKDIDNKMFETLEEVKKATVEKIKEIYEKENFMLLEAYNKAIEETKENNADKLL